MEATWEALLGVSAAWKPIPARWGNRFANKRLVELQRLGLWFVRSCCSQGVGATIKWLKDAASECRLSSVEEGPLGPKGAFLTRKILIGCRSREALDQLAFLGRSLPAGDKVVQRASLLSHREAVTSVTSTDPALLSSARRFAEWFARKHLTPADLRETVVPTPSASLATTRREGGSREEVREEHRLWIQDLPRELWSRDDALTFMDYAPYFADSEVDSVRSNQGSIDVARAAAWLTASRTVRSRVTCVAERGWKQRIVSAPPAFATTAGGCLNKALLRGVRRYGPCSLFLKGDRRKAVETVMAASRGRGTIVSTDLTAASDRLPHDLVKAVVVGITDGWKDLPPLWAESLFALTGPQELRYPWGQVVTSTAGILMGLGPTWPILSVIHAWWVETAWSSLGYNPRSQLRLHCIGGDDLLARWPLDVVESYRKIVALCGGKRSAGKDFLSDTGGNFTEMSIFVEGLSWRWSRAIPTKGLVASSIDEVGAAYESLGSDPSRRLRGRHVLWALHPDAWSVCRALAVPATLPRSLGGAGLPPMHGSPLRVEAPLRTRLALGRFLYGSGVDTVPLGPPSWTEAGDPAVWQARTFSEERLRGALEIGILRYTRTPDPEARESKRVVDHLADQMAYFARARVFSDTRFPPVATEIVSVRKYSRLVRRWVLGRIRGGLPRDLAIRHEDP
nr:MAG: RNA-dependent RNA polymerase [Narnaviridae sp.]